MSRFKSIADVWSYLEQIPTFQSAGVSAANFSLVNISAFCEKLGNPHRSFPSIHIAGTNGKGTTAYLLEAIYRSGGYRTGLFTSPHLLRYNERVRVNGADISDEAILEFFQYTEALLQEIPLSYFEISTALAFWYFNKSRVEIAIIETGLGGRLDSTNIINPEVSVITSIGLDHQNVLGNTIQEIAREKAGIIKPKKPVVTGNISDAALQQITAVAEANGSQLYDTAHLQPVWNKGIIHLRNNEIKLHSLLRESVNKWNVACAWQVREVLQASFPVSESALIGAIEAFEGAPGRFEKLHKDFDWYFSGSHNQQALLSSIETIEHMKGPENTILIFSAMKDKLNAEMMQLFKPFMVHYFVEQKGERAAKKEDVELYLKEIRLMNDVNAVKILKDLRTELVIFTGSFYFYPIVKRWISKVENF